MKRYLVKFIDGTWEFVNAKIYYVPGSSRVATFFGMDDKPMMSVSLYTILYIKEIKEDNGVVDDDGVDGDGE